MFYIGTNESVTSRHHVTALRYMYICIWQSLGATLVAQPCGHQLFSHSTHMNQRKSIGFTVFFTKKRWFFNGFRIQTVGINEKNIGFTVFC